VVEHLFGLISTHHADIPVHRRYPLIRILLQQLARDQLLQRQDDTILTPDADGCAAVLHRLDCVLDLEVAAIGREDGVGEIVSRAYRGLG
jgi:hypothetical protein